ncbi:sigma-70 family RNA polymerase sigma factor [Sediminibacillus halophilus]|uniref:RNA polymerase sigma-70 factor, ECF subfamily n=1 Tax=Sediminibacillus halophilus TaxID=482461 RepID=A0A1G9QMV2_9BACI|nr:sigma-70 family RNA polymerase sigma factor [Sediminibacillus halophilus]SDM12326.1 RNA polymerase sigma-70 factor, ECF subfamily [Sediminibacillus halophilus]
MEKGAKEDLLEEIMLKHGDDLVRLAFNYVKDKETAKDMVQNSFIKCYENLDEFRYDSTIKTWLYRITVNQCKDYLRSWHYRKVKTKSVFVHALKSISSLTENEVIKKSESEEMKSLMFSLPESYREVIYLYYYKDLSIPEIAEVTNLNPNTVKTRLRRGKQRMKRLLEEAEVYGEIY